MPISTFCDQNRLSHALRVPSAGYFPDYQYTIIKACPYRVTGIATAIMYQLNSYSAYLDPNYTPDQKLSDRNIHTALFYDLPVGLLHSNIIKRDDREVPQPKLAYQWHQEEEKTNHTRYALYQAMSLALSSLTRWVPY